MDMVTGSADRALIEKWDQNLRACQQQRVNLERQWHENIAFFRGRQWIVTTKNANGFTLMEQPSTDRWRVRHTANRILRVIRTELTKLTKEEPEFFCAPSSMDERDRLAAMAGDAIAEFIIRTKYFNRKRLEATFWALLCGTAFLKNYYDPDALELDGLPGKISFEAVPPHQLFVPNLQTTEMEGQSYCIHARTMNPEDVWNSYKVDLPASTEAASVLDARFQAALGIKQPTSNLTKQCYIKECYIKPCKDFPAGALIVYGEQKILYVHEALPEIPQQQPPVGIETEPKGSTSSIDSEEEPPVGKSIYEGLQNYNHAYPYKHGRFPFTKIDHILSGMFYGTSVIEHLISPQKEYNRTRSVMLEHRNLGSKPQFWFTEGAFDPKKFNSRPGLLLAVRMGFEPPKPLEQPPLPPTLGNELEITLRDMDDIASQYEITKGRTPPGVEAASAIAYLSEENDSILYPAVQSLENAVQETGIQVLANVHDYWDPERTVRMTSKSQYLEVREFHATDLLPLMDFRVVAGSMAPRSPAARQAQLMDMAKLGVIQPQELLKYMQSSETDKMFEDMTIDYRHAQRENVYMSHGMELVKPDTEQQPQIDPMTGQAQPIPKTDVLRDPTTGQPQIGQDGQPITYKVTTNPFDAHEAHVYEHQKFQKTQEYELLPPEIQKIIQDHVDEHKMEILKEKLAIEADQAAKGEVPQEEVAPPAEMQPVGPNPNGQV